MSTSLDHRIPDKIYFRIGEVCDLIKVQPHVLRYWESEFPMLAPQKNRAGQRVYRRKDVEMVLRIHDLLYEEKFTIAGARKKLLDDMRRSASARSAQAAREPIDPAPVAQTSVSGRSSNPVKTSVCEPASTVAQTSVCEPGSTQEPLPYSDLVEPQQAAASETQQAVQKLKRELEDLLTLLNAEC
jgi:DNA-binding transcriptional MerR regulator